MKWIDFVNYGPGESKDLIFRLTISRQFSFRWYDREQGLNWGRRRLGPKRFAIDLGRISLVFENYDFP